MQPGAILYSRLSAQAIEQLVLSHYELIHPVECIFFTSGVNDTYQVRTHSEPFALRLYRPRTRGREVVAPELAALLHLRKQGVPVAAPVARSDGELITQITVPEGSRCAALFEWVDGDEPRYINPTHAQLYGNAAARLHLAGDELPASLARSPLDADYLLEEPVANLRPWAAPFPLLAARFEALVERLRTRFEHTREQLSDWGFCHGDLHFGNAHVADNRLQVYDFDFCGPGWRVYDLATYRWAARMRNVEQRAWTPFIEAYLQLRPVPAAELEAVPLFVLLRHIWLMGFFAGSTRHGGASGWLNQRFFHDFMQFCERVESQPMLQSREPV
jgi:Ser/Thr protein kinase RdoA (MazF antagonist)